MQLQLNFFGTSKEIELEKSVLESNEYSDKVSEILKAVKYIEHFQLSYLFLISHNYFTYPGSSNSFFSITYATFASLLIKEHISIILQKAL